MQFDHVEIYVTDRAIASAWYGEVLGFYPVPEFADWANEGPLMLANDHQQMVALFIGPPQKTYPVRGLRRLAFRVSADEFSQFIGDSVEWADPPLGLGSIQDHELAISVYFADPYGNPLEVTTYDYLEAKAFVDSLEPNRGH